MSCVIILLLICMVLPPQDAAAAEDDGYVCGIARIPLIDLFKVVKCGVK